MDRYIIFYRNGYILYAGLESTIPKEAIFNSEYETFTSYLEFEEKLEKLMEEG